MPYQVSWERCHVCGHYRDVVEIPNRPDHWNYSQPLPVCKECLGEALKAFAVAAPPGKQAG